MEALRQLVPICDNKMVASVLNRNGLVTAHGHRWCRMAITSLRSKRGIAVHSSERQRAEGWMNLTEAAARLGVSPKTIRKAAEGGEINAMHPLHDAPWIFRRADIDDPYSESGSRSASTARWDPQDRIDVSSISRFQLHTEVKQYETYLYQATKWPTHRPANAQWANGRRGYAGVCLSVRNSASE